MHLAKKPEEAGIPSEADMRLRVPVKARLSPEPGRSRLVTTPLWGLIFDQSMSEGSWTQSFRMG